MSTATLPQTDRPGYALTTPRILRAEWHKLWSLRSTWITVLSACAIVLAVGITMGSTYDGDDADVDTVLFVLYGSTLSQIILAVLGILVTAGEYATGMIRSSVAAVPRRLPVLWAKTTVFGAAVLTITLATNAVTFLTAQIWLGDTDKAASLTDANILAPLVGNAVGTTLLALTALGLGALLRSVPGAIGALIGGIVILPEVLSTLPWDGMKDIVTYFPTQAASALGTHTPMGDEASTAGALIALVVWAGGVLALAAVFLKRRDV
ncbi:ABC transporter permease [Streptomyces sp. NPDC050738]|uniref:ABC transporter permease n=1 Tax=Streptomyces sp. NPDC050738 TaxID=3154744 RepID=UPI00342EBFC8